MHKLLRLSERFWPEIREDYVANPFAPARGVSGQKRASTDTPTQLIWSGGLLATPATLAIRVRKSDRALLHYSIAARRNQYKSSEVRPNSKAIFPLVTPKIPHPFEIPKPKTYFPFSMRTTLSKSSIVS